MCSNKLLFIMSMMTLLSVAPAFFLSFREDKEASMTAPQIIRYHGYPCETHHAYTKDGYILELHRIPHGKNKVMNRTTDRPAVLVHHGLLCSSSNWVENLPKQSLGFHLADAGNDVWLANARGNFYSKKHVNLSINSLKYWDFTWQEMAKYDLPALIDYVLETTNKSQLYYVGHSQGATIGLAAFSEDQTLGSKIKTFFAMAPVATCRYISNKLVHVARKVEEIVASLFAHKEFLSKNDKLKDAFKEICSSSVRICSNLIFAIGGFQDSKVNITRLPIYIHSTPAGTSVKNMLHFTQMIDNGQFEAFNYKDVSLNLEKYNSIIPPKYDVQKVNVKTVVFYGGKDTLADEKDVKQLIGRLPFAEEHYEKERTHVGFMWAIDAAEGVYRKISDRISL